MGYFKLSVIGKKTSEDSIKCINVKGAYHPSMLGIALLYNHKSEADISQILGRGNLVIKMSDVNSYVSPFDLEYKFYDYKKANLLNENHFVIDNEDAGRVRGSQKFNYDEYRYHYRWFYIYDNDEFTKNGQPWILYDNKHQKKYVGDDYIKICTSVRESHHLKTHIIREGLKTDLLRKIEIKLNNHIKIYDKVLLEEFKKVIVAKMFQANDGIDGKGVKKRYPEKSKSPYFQRDFSDFYKFIDDLVYDILVEEIYSVDYYKMIN